MSVSTPRTDRRLDLGFYAAALLMALHSIRRCRCGLNLYGEMTRSPLGRFCSYREACDSTFALAATCCVDLDRDLESSGGTAPRSGLAFMSAMLIQHRILEGDNLCAGNLALLTINAQYNGFLKALTRRLLDAQQRR